jgi:Fic family protein
MEKSAFSANAPGKLVATTNQQFAFVPNNLPPFVEIDWGLAAEISAADRRLGELAGAACTLPNPHLLIGPFTRREAVLSSKIEGTQASLSDLLSFEALGPGSDEKSDVQEVANYVSALEYGLSRIKDLPVSLRLIREVHERLMRGVRGQSRNAGEFRTIQNWIGPPGCQIGAATYVPPPVPAMKDALDAFERYIHQPPTLPPLVRMAMLHYQFEAIHPFLDGNGRVGRLLITLMLVSEKIVPQPLLYLSAFFERYRSDYYGLLLNVSLRGEWTQWIKFFLRGVTTQAEDALVRASKLQQLSAEYRTRLQEKRQSANLLKVADSLFVRPVITAQAVASLLRVTQKSAQDIIEKLIEAGILLEITGRKRGRVYLAQRIFSVMEDDEPQQLNLKLPDKGLA